MRDSSIIRYNEVHDMYDKIIKDLGDMSAYSLRIQRLYL